MRARMFQAGVGPCASDYINVSGGVGGEEPCMKIGSCLAALLVDAVAPNAHHRQHLSMRTGAGGAYAPSTPSRGGAFATTALCQKQPPRTCGTRPLGAPSGHQWSRWGRVVVPSLCNSSTV